MTSNRKLDLLTSQDPTPAGLINRKGRSLFLLLGDHAGNRVPERLMSLGLDGSDLSRHIALDIGVEKLGRCLADELDAPFVFQRYSRLVIDCNRALSHADSIVAESDGIRIPGNNALRFEQRQVRACEIYAPYHNAIADLLAERDNRGLQSIIVSLHSFTPTLAGEFRPWQVGVLYNKDHGSFASTVLSDLRNSDLVVGDNRPYQFDDTDFTVPKHAIADGRSYVEFEVRQDMLEALDAIAAMTQQLSRVLVQTAAKS